ncbi:MAG: 5'/3'-nucleotidase SurE [Bacteroidales bacterium]|nr:5'/3'-nucleotidase SurE [Bacteroidales bacterium]MDD2425604.1 5'/3'-nucleotidase SurE [Bacteroidales bacterium]MDD3989911.1 5'/3'-nucleotidase SurE [Bacteroidales bacterium]MDD4638742.1 5'/3'-nucleotidase SurE [Bacteroidales bacterium]
MEKRRSILITNDDGIKSKGISVLTAMMTSYGDVTVVAPLEAQSGMSAALTIGKPLRLTELKNEKGLRVYACTGTPADCVKMAMNQLYKGSLPDLLISGINHGSNASVASLYSGTLGAAAEGTVYGIPSLGFSLCSHNPEADFSIVEVYGKIILDNFFKNPVKADVFLNVNFPALKPGEAKGIRFSHQGKGKWIKEFEERTDPYGFNYYWMTGEFFNLEPDNLQSDHNVMEMGYVSIVPHKIDTTDYDELQRLESIWKL